MRYRIVLIGDGIIRDEVANALTAEGHDVTRACDKEWLEATYAHSFGWCRTPHVLINLGVYDHVLSAIRADFHAFDIIDWEHRANQDMIYIRHGMYDFYFDVMRYYRRDRKVFTLDRRKSTVEQILNILKDTK